MITVGSLFAGIGGLDLGLERAGMRILWQVEKDSYCNRVLAKHWPNVSRYGDVRDVGKHNLEPVDLICGGFPCQPHSVAGKRKGKDDERNLWPEYRRIVGELRPTWVLGENVPGLRTTMLDDIILDLEGIGYTVGIFDIPALAVGAPHLRHRLFIVAHTTGEPIDRDRGKLCCSWNEEWPEVAGCRSGQYERDADATLAHADSGDAPNGRQCTSLSPKNRGWRDDGGRSCGDSWEIRMGCARKGASSMADADSAGQQERWGAEPMGTEQRSAECGGQALAHSDSRRCEQCDEAEWAMPIIEAGNWWSVEPSVCELADGISPGLVRYAGRVARNVPNRVNKLRCLGNAVVPQVAELVGRMIIIAQEQQCLSENK